MRYIALSFVVLALAACGGSSPQPIGSSHPASSHPVVHVTTTAPPTLAQQYAAWYNGTGEADYKAVTADGAKLWADRNATVTDEADGAVLSSDAATAALNPPPGPAKAPYAAAMKLYAEAGTAASSGDFTTANADVSAGNTFAAKVTTLLNAEGL